MKQLPGWLSGLIIVLVAFGAVSLLVASTKTAEQQKVNADAPALRGTTTTGTPFQLSDYRGKIVLLNFWGTWCPPCLQELPDLVALQKEYEAKGFTIIGVAENRNPNLTEEQYRKELQGFITEHGMTYPNVPTPEGAKQAYGLEGFPTTFLIDKNGKIVHAVLGPVDSQDMAARIEKLL